MKILKKTLLLIVLSIFFLSCSDKQSLEWIPFQWKSDTISGKYIEKAYLFVPVKIDDLPHDFTMQLDLGTYKTVFYGNSINPYMEEYPSLTEKYKIPVFKDITLQMGRVRFNGVDIGYYNNGGETIPKDSIRSKTPKHIGTIAPDLFGDRVLIIDYKSCRFAVSDSLPDQYKELEAQKFELTDGIIKLPFRINGNDCNLLFDTGSSPFPLATSKERALAISDPIVIDSLSGPLWWGENITFYGHRVNKPIEFGGRQLRNSTVYYDKEGLWENNVFTPLNVWGLTGNAYFFDNTVIIDYKNQLFRIK